jgi:fructose-specific phosphotransferase system IIA component
MRLLDYLNENLIFLNLEVKDKNDALEKIVALMAQKKVIQQPHDFLAALLVRENLGSTAIGDGIALPHARLNDLNRITIVCACLKKGIDFEAEDQKPVNLIFLLGTPPAMATEYLMVLAKLSRLLKEKGLHDKLIKAGSPAEIIEIICENEC